MSTKETVKANARAETSADKPFDNKAMIDRLVSNANQALEEYMSFSQEQVDKIVHAMSLAGLEAQTKLAKMAYEETGRGVMEDKIIKNVFATEYIWHSIKYEKTVGIINENEMEGYVEIAEPVGVVAGVTPVSYTHLLLCRLAVFVWSVIH